MLQTAESMGVQMPTLRAIAMALDCNPQRVYNTAKKPIPGVTYDPHQYNWDAITAFIEKRLDPEIGCGTKEELITKALEIDAQLTERDGRKSRTGGAKQSIDVGDGHMIPQRRVDVNVGDTVLLKRDDRVFEAVYVNDASVVLQPMVPPSLVLTTISNWTLNQKLITNPDLIESEKARRIEAYEEQKALAAASEEE